MGHNVPFRRALEPLVADPGADVLKQTSRAVLAMSAARDLTEGLAAQLSQLLTPLLLDEFLEHPGRRYATPTSTEAHDGYCEYMANGGLYARLRRSRLLTEAVESTVARWRRTAVAAAECARTDRAVLASSFGIRLPFVTAEPRGADGWRLVDERDHSVVFKHRSLGMEAALNEVLRWVNDHGPSRDLFIPKTITSDAHGWTQHLEPRPGDTPADDRDFDHRVGMLIGLNYALGGGDMHRGNVRRCGPHPVILDAEKVLRPTYPGEDPVEVTALSTGWLPIPGLNNDIANCGLASEHWIGQSGRVVASGSDAVRLRPRRVASYGVRQKLARSITAQRRSDIASGFRETHTLVRAHGLPLEPFAHCDVRVVVRYFGHYWAATDRLFEPPAVFRADEQRQIEERLLRTPSPLASFGAYRPAVERLELRAVRQMRAPRFTTPATGTSLVGQAETIGSPFTASPTAASDRIQRSMRDDLVRLHCEHIDRALDAAAGDPVIMTNGYTGRWRVLDGVPT